MDALDSRRAEAEERVLKRSIVMTLLVAMTGVVFGVIAGANSIVFDGVYSLVDASMSGLALVVVKIITSDAVHRDLPRKWRERFTMGFWHFEPIVLGLNGTLLVGAAVYAFINALMRMVSGGNVLEFGPASIYAMLAAGVCFTMAALQARANRKIRSDFLRLDIKSWVMSGGISTALLFAFGAGYAIQRTTFAYLSPYVDPLALALVCVVIIPIPLAEVRRSLLELLLVTPPELKSHVDAIAARFVERYAFLYFRSYVAKVGRSREIELYFVIQPTSAPRPMSEWDAIRDEIGRAVGGDDAHRWLTVIFTSDPAWAE